MLFQGEQVFITYGLQSNDKLLQYYGFVEPKNPADVYVVPDLLEALRDLPYLRIPEEGVQAAKQAGLSVALQKVRRATPDLSHVMAYMPVCCSVDRVCNPTQGAWIVGLLEAGIALLLVCTHDQLSCC